MKNYYELLGVAQTATADQIKHAFRQQIARYHPDKVQHLGAEFQEMAATRAAELTEAYRALNDDVRRAAYDAELASGADVEPAVSARETAPPPTSPEGPSPKPGSQAAGRAEPAEKGGPEAEAFSRDRRTRDEFVRRMAVSRFRQILKMEFGSVEEIALPGFDIAVVPKSGLFARAKHPRLAVRFVPRLDGTALTETVTLAARAASTETCVFLIGGSVMPDQELAAAFAELRRQSRSAHVVVVPVDARDWSFKIPVQAPPIARKLLDRLRG